MSNRYGHRFTSGQRIKVSNPPTGEENAWLRDKVGTIVRDDGVYLVVAVDGHENFCLLDDCELEAA